MKPFAFILITYNRPSDMLELLKNLSTLHSFPDLVEEIIVINNASTEDYAVVEKYIENSSLPIRYHRSPTNLGVTKGRNEGIAMSRAPILIMIDDDAVLGNRDCLQNLVKEFERKTDDRKIAVVSFKVIYYDTGEMQVNALPHKRFDEYHRKEFFETYYYAGGAHAILRKVMEELGGYPDDFFYGMEEYDLSYRILEAGYAIVYTDKVVMLHKESPEGRPARKEKLSMMWINKARVAFRYLPKRFFYSTAFMWSFEYLRKSGFDLKGFFKGWSKVTSIPGNEFRRKISAETLDYLKKVKARIWY